MTPETAAIVVAAVAGIPATIASVGAWRQANKANKAVNGRPPEAPTISDDVAALRVQVANLAGDVEGLTGRLDRHLEAHDRPRRRGW